jgi:UDP-sugar transporter A1/2/3
MIGHLDVSQPSIMGIPIKYVSLIILSLQNSILVLLMKQSKLRSEVPYLHSTTIMIGEWIKLCICCMAIFKEKKLKVKQTMNYMYQKIYLNRKETFVMIIPAFLYSIQNNLIFISITHLDVVTFQVTYQLKILTTALFSHYFLIQRLTFLKWISLSLLALGVGLVQLLSYENGDPFFNQRMDEKGRNLFFQFIPFRWIGFISLIIASFTSGFSGVYFEKHLKGSTTSIWIRNIQLCLFSILFSILFTLISDLNSILHQGFFHGYTPLVWLMILIGAMGGLIVAIVVKYADNILKGFATSISILLSALVSTWIFDLKPTPLFWMGTFLVMLAVLIYNLSPSS